ncbi:MAG: hypothetical protein R3277_11630 [Brumimicrobium sp.]|nr:hypothetical protein [Brumimicrobium sp.]
MYKLSQKEFRKCSLERRYFLLKKHADYIGGRQHGLHRIHLFSFSGYFVEVWILIAFDQVQWIEIQNNKSVLESYTENINIKKSLGL